MSAFQFMPIVKHSVPVSALVAFLVTSPAQQVSADHMGSLARIVEDATTNYPSIRITQEDLKASAASLALARTAYLPRVDGVVQFNRGTRNNVFGSLLPQTVIAPMSGPVIGTNNGGSVWGSATGLLINWQPFDFGLRGANVEAATASRDRANAAIQRTRLEIGTVSADTYLTVIAALKTRSAAQAAVDEWGVLGKSVHALVATELRPGADETRIEAERAAAVTQLALAEQAVAISGATLRKFISDPVVAPVQDGRLVSELPVALDPEAEPAATVNPALTEQHAMVQENAALLRSLERSWVPQISLEGAAYARGTGAETNGQRLAGANGLAPTVGNYVVGVNVTFSFLDFASIHAREAAQAAHLRAAQANELLTTKNLQEEFAQAQATLRASRTIAENTPVQLKAAQASLDQATARYKAGLAPIDDVAQSQRLLVQAQIDDSIAHLNVWRAFLRLTYVRGDIQPFLQEAIR